MVRSDPIHNDVQNFAWAFPFRCSTTGFGEELSRHGDGMPLNRRLLLVLYDELEAGVPGWSSVRSETCVTFRNLEAWVDSFYHISILIAFIGDWCDWLCVSIAMSCVLSCVWEMLYWEQRGKPNAMNNYCIYPYSLWMIWNPSHYVYQHFANVQSLTANNFVLG